MAAPLADSRSRRRPIAALALALALVGAVILAFTAGPRDDPFGGSRSFGQWVVDPLETNPQMRLPTAGGTITAIAVVPGTRTVRAVGMRGLAIVSTDGGATWRPDSALLRAHATPPLTRAARNPQPVDVLPPATG